VDVGARTFPAACVRACEEGMNVVTSSPRIESARRMLVALLLADHPIPCQKERTTGDCELEALARRYGILSDCGLRIADCGLEEKDKKGRESLAAPLQSAIDDSSPVIAVDHAACILCDRCIRACDEVQSNQSLGGPDARSRRASPST